MDIYERHLMIKLMEKLIKKTPETVSNYAEKIFSLVSEMINSDQFLFWVEAKELITTLSKAIGLSKVIMILRMNLDS